MGERIEGAVCKRHCARPDAIKAFLALGLLPFLAHRSLSAFRRGQLKHRRTECRGSLTSSARRLEVLKDTFPGLRKIAM
jgi:hypothetical protein